MDTSKIREAVLDKARQEAEELIARAEERADTLMAEARSRREQQVREAGDEILRQARQEAARVLARADLAASQELTGRKDAVLTSIIAKARAALGDLPCAPELLARLIDESVGGMETRDGIRLLVATRDVATARELVDKDPRLKTIVREVQTREGLGGVAAEGLDGMVSVDNTYETRLEMLLPEIVPRLAGRFKQGGQE